MVKSRTTSLAVVATLALGLTACGGDQAGSGGDNYVLAYGTEPQNPLIPGNTNEVGGGRIIEQIYSGLVYYDAEGKAHNDAAESIELEGDKTYRVTLREGAQWSDGTPVKASDFVDAWNFTMQQSYLAASFYEPILGFEEGKESMEGLKVVDDRTFTIELNQPEADFPERLGTMAFFPLHPSAFDDVEGYGEKPIGNGPYTLDSWNHNQDATLIANESYNGERKAQNDGLTFVFYAQQDAAYSDLLAGNLDVLDAIPDSAFATYQDELQGRAINQPAAIFQGITIPNGLEHFSGEEGKLRRAAISRAIDREEIADTIFHGARTPATDFTSPVLPGHADKLNGAEVLSYDPEEAKRLWAEADKISPFTGQFSISYNADGGHQAWVDAVVNSLRNTLGIDAAGNAYPDFKSLREEVTNRTITGAFRTGYQADYPSVGNLLTQLYQTNASSNDGDYSNPDYDALLRQAASAGDLEAATPEFAKAQEILLQDLPKIPLWYANATGGYFESVDNVTFAWDSAPLYHLITKE